MTNTKRISQTTSKVLYYRVRVATLICLIFLSLITSRRADAATYYLDAANGNDNNNGDVTHPWKTLAKANAVVVAGDTVKFRSGSYGEVSLTTSSPKGTSWDAPITYQADTGHTPIFDMFTFSGQTTAVNHYYYILNGLRINIPDTVPRRTAAFILRAVTI